MQNDIITALSTAWGEGGIAIVRISGARSVELAERIFTGHKKLSEYPARFLVLGQLRNNQNNVFDEVLAVRFEEGASYTAEESVEIHCHGGTLPAQKCVEELCTLGARLAQPGEFTKRAFLHGRIDLTQAEAVMGVIRARSDEALRASGRTLQGTLTLQLKKLLEQLTMFSAQLEVDLDFPEEGQGLLLRQQCAKTIAALIAEAEELLLHSRSGLLLREGLKVAIVGRPNVGKSSLLNALLAEARAIVTPTPGTTRDRIEEVLTHKGVPIRLIDTAGIRKTTDEVESLGVQQSVDAMTEADLRIWVVDAGQTLLEEEIELGKKAAAFPHLIVINKQDLPKKTTDETLHEDFPGSEILSVSALKSEGVETLKDAIVAKMTNAEHLTDGYSVTARQLECLAGALAAMKEAQNVLAKDLGDDLTTSCITEARTQLAALLGLDPTEELLDAVFSSFCVGK